MYCVTPPWYKDTFFNRPVGRGVHVHSLPPFRLKFISNSVQCGVFKTVINRIYGHWPPTSL